VGEGLFVASGDLVMDRGLSKSRAFLAELVMDVETSSRLFALELLIANLIGERLRNAPDPPEASGQALKRLLTQIDQLPLEGPDGSMHANLRSQSGDAVASVMRMAMDRAQA
jgi:hypothetical protein